MRFIRCDGDNCGATYPATAAFCPRCGKPTAYRPRRRFAALHVICALLAAMFVARAFVRHPAMPLPPPPVPPMEQVGPTDSDISDALSSLESFDQARQSWTQDKSERKRFTDLVTGRRVHWTGRLRSSLRPGTFKLTSTDPQSPASIHLMTATSEAKEQAKKIKSGTIVEIEGVMTDEHLVYVVSVSRPHSCPNSEV
jgi:hypothetical protein